MTRYPSLLLSVLCLAVLGQTGPEGRVLELGKPLEREVAGGESQSYRLALTAGQFMRV